MLRCQRVVASVKELHNMSVFLFYFFCWAAWFKRKFTPLRDACPIHSSAQFKDIMWEFVAREWRAGFIRGLCLRGQSQHLVIWRLLVQFPWFECQTVLGQDTEPQTPLLLMCWSAPFVAATTICVWMYVWKTVSHPLGFVHSKTGRVVPPFLWSEISCCMQCHCVLPLRTKFSLSCN